MDKISICVDGACSHNNLPETEREMAVAIYVDGEELLINKIEPSFSDKKSNNVAELEALIMGMGTAKILASTVPKPIIVYSDSQYAIGCATQNWKIKANKELVQQARKLHASLPDSVTLTHASDNPADRALKNFLTE